LLKPRRQASGRWYRQGSNIVIELSGDSPVEPVSHEFESTVRRGSTGPDVKALQARLQALGFNPGPIDGIFGAGTDAAVRAFQISRGLQADGIAGPLTWAAVEAPAGPPPPQSWKPPGGSGRPVHVTVPFYGYQTNDKAGCFRRCVEMAAAVGTRVGGPDVRIQVAVREDAAGRVSIDPAKAREGLAYLDSQLDADHPVVVGVSYTITSYNVDDITDHFVIITTRGTDPQRGLYYGFHDPASAHLYLGGDQNLANRFYFTPGGVLYRPASSSAPMGSKPYDVAMVRRNL